MQKQDWEYVWHFKLQTSRSSHSVKTYNSYNILFE